MADWITTAEFSYLAGMSERRARKIFQEVELGRRSVWSGAALVVRTIRGQPGRFGKNYSSRLSSLPPDLQARWKALQTPVEGLSKPLSGRHAERSWWLHILGPALDTAKASPERAAAFNAILAERHVDLHGRPVNFTLRLLRRRMERMESAGSTGPLARFRRADKGKRRVFISREWDRRVRFSDKEKEAIARDLQSEIRSHVAAGATWGQTIELCSRFLAKVSQRGFPITDATELLRVCQVPKALVQAELHYRKLDQHRTDRKAIEDSRPRIKRKMDGLRPMELVVMDVHPLDVAVQRADGTEAHPRLLAFLDLATQRCWCELVFFDKRGGVRNVDMIEAFVRMAAHPAFGVPEQVYCDNGSEYLFAAFLDDAMQIAWPGSSRRLRVVNALPYNAAAKPVEQWFARIEGQHLSRLPGYRGGNRMNNRQEAVGRNRTPFAGGFDAFHDAFFGQLWAYEAMPQKRGQLSGMSPKQAFARHVADGWTAVVMDPENLLVAFTRPDASRRTRSASCYASAK